MSETKPKIAAIVIRGMIGVNKDIKDTLQMLNLNRKLSCVILQDTPVVRGMLQKCKDYITYGEVSTELINELDAVRKQKNNHYSLSPPRGGFERMGIKTPYTSKGALGYRGEKMNDLIRKMM